MNKFFCFRIREVLSVFLTLFITLSVVPFVNAEQDTVPQITATHGVILMTSDTGSVLYENNSTMQTPIASTTKILSTMLVLESGKDLDEKFVVDSKAIKVEGSSMGLREGDIVTLRDLCYGMILPSGNDAANASAVRVSGSIDAFVKKMNERASSLGMKSSNFSTPSGLDSKVSHYSTAIDMANLTREAFKNPDFCEIAETYSKSLNFGNPPYQRTLYNHNKLLKMYKGACGVKTGFTEKAGRCLVSAAEREGVKLICVVLGDPNDWKDSMALFDYGFSQVTSCALPSDFSNMRLPVVGGDKLYLSIKSGDIPSFALNDTIKQKINYKVKVDPIYYAPVKSGEKIGEVEYYCKNSSISTVPLYASENIKLYEEKASIQSMSSKFNTFINKLHVMRNLY